MSNEGLFIAYNFTRAIIHANDPPHDNMKNHFKNPFRKQNT